MSTRNSSRFTPIIIAISVVAGILIGTFYAKHFAGNRLGIINGSSNKLNALLRIVDDQYVDTVNMTDLVEKAMPQILAELDPHSTYIPAQNLEEVNSELEGSFSGIGIQFTIQNDTIHVNAVIQGGPSEKVGLMAGDRIVNVDDSLFVGKKLNNELAMRTLKGPKGSQVKLGVKRVGEPKLLDFTITRGDIPQNTVDAAYMLNDDIGYVKVSKFGRTSHVELLNALAQLNHKKCKGLIIDLRGNTGGYMEAAIRMVNEFLPEGKLIVYTQGRKYPRSEEFANGTGSCQKMPLVVLIDEGSASASEIFTGAIQDNDRGTVVGRRSFGKGLVQQPIDFSDGSAIRLTIARYYTPSGRCIQRPYESGKDRNYELDLYNRYEHGEFFSPRQHQTKRERTLSHQPGTYCLWRWWHHAGRICTTGYHRSHFLSVIRNQPRTDSSVYFPVHGQQPEETEPVRNGRRVTELPPSPRSGRAVYPLRRYQRCKEKKHSDPEIIQTSGSEYLWQHHL